MKRLRLSTSTEVRRALSKVANMVLNHELKPSEANAILYACNTVLSAIRVDDQQKKLDELVEEVREKQ